ncbi:hypothetical protein J4450_01130 [Candidatus Micrarchaeota archaeon]|nr:hypothetical protein [Candidatus Micrarchaeota archaeon]
MAEEKQKPDEKIDLAVVLVSHLFLGGGIYILGKTLKNKKEEVFGLIFAILSIGTFLYFLFLPCQDAKKELIGGECELTTILFIIGALSWIYVIARVIQNRKKVILSLKNLGEA